MNGSQRLRQTDPARTITSALLPLLVLTSLAVSAAAADEARFEPLFNGRDLEGWVNVNCAPETWTVTNGVIYCTGKPTGALRTTRQYENFILELEWRHLRSGGNAGVFLWAGAISAPGVPFLRSIEVQVLDHGYGQSESYTTHGDVFPIHGSTMKPHGRSRGMRSFPSENRSKASPEWNHYRIVATNGVLRLSVNGKEVSGGSDCNYRNGYIALESEGSPVEFRNLRIQELPSTGATAEMTAPVDPGWIPLYTGLDLRGWMTPAGREKIWVPSDWRLVLKPQPDTAASVEPAPSWLTAARGDLEFIMDFRLPKEADLSASWLGLCVRGAARPVMVIGDSGAPVAAGRALVKPAQWHRIHATLRGRSFSVRLDGQPAGEHTLTDDAGGDGALGLLDFNRPLEIASLYYRPLR